jgi:hypothetical protein
MPQAAKIGVLYLLAVSYGIRDIHYWLPSILDQLIPFAISLTLLQWAIDDARRRGRPLPLTAQGSMFMVAPMAVSIYLLWTRTWRGAGLLLAHAIGLSIVRATVMHSGGLLLFGRDWLRALGLAA